MIYIPQEFFIDLDNMDRVHEILQALNKDLVFEADDTRANAIKELEKLKEFKIVEKLEEGFFDFGA